MLLGSHRSRPSLVRAATPSIVKLPGEPSNIVALGDGKAEMTTSSGAIYTTKNAGLNWSAQVRMCASVACSSRELLNTRGMWGGSLCARRLRVLKGKRAQPSEFMR